MNEEPYIAAWVATGMSSLVIILVTLFQPVDAREGFYLMVGIGASDSPPLIIENGHGDMIYEFEWQDGGELGCGFGSGVMFEVGDQWLLNWGYQHRSQCNYWGHDETSVDHLFLDLYWFPFQ